MALQSDRHFDYDKKLTPGFTRYLEPTVLTNVPRDSLALTDETFGPCKSLSHHAYDSCIDSCI